MEQGDKATSAGGPDPAMKTEQFAWEEKIQLSRLD